MNIQYVKRNKNINFSILSASSLKILACIFMFIDHFGVRLYPEVADFRIIGRLAYPIFAFFIAEGCKYTKNKVKRIITILLFGIICEISYLLYSGNYYGNILFTFTLSIILIYAIQHSKYFLLKKQYIKAALIIITILPLIYIAAKLMRVDYGFYGVLSPVFVSALDYKEGKTPEFFKKLDNHKLKLVSFSIGLILLIYRYGINSVQLFSIFAVPLLALYNGKQGAYKLKYAFYLYYPLHLMFIEFLAKII